MTLEHLYDLETGKYMRSQEPIVDPLETEVQGKVVYVKYPNSTTKPLPEYGEHYYPFFIDDEWVVKEQFKNVEVYNPTTRVFENCPTDELDGRVFIDDPEGIKKFKEERNKWLVVEEAGEWKIVLNPNYEVIKRVEEIDQELMQCDQEYQAYLDTAQQWEVNNHLYKPKWVDDGTYTKIITGASVGLIQFPIDIWDATEKEENMVSMDQNTFGALCAWLAQLQAVAFNTRKAKKSALIEEREGLINKYNLDI